MTRFHFTKAGWTWHATIYCMIKGSFIMDSCKEKASSAVQKPEKKSMLSHCMLFYCIFWPLRWCREKMTDCNSINSMIILSQWVMYMKILFRTINYERLFRCFEQSCITSQFSVSLPAAQRSLFWFPYHAKMLPTPIITNNKAVMSLTLQCN